VSSYLTSKTAFLRYRDLLFSKAAPGLSIPCFFLSVRIPCAVGLDVERVHMAAMKLVMMIFIPLSEPIMEQVGDH
jgi:hypothetical protein